MKSWAAWGYLSGNALYAICTSSALADQRECLGYVEGVMDVGVHYGPQCLPDGTVAQQVMDVVKNYMRDQPQDRSDEASSLVVLAVTKAWNCK